MTITEIKIAFIAGDVVFFIPRFVDDYLTDKRGTLPGAPFKSTTNIPRGKIDQIMNNPVIVAGALVDKWTASASGQTLNIDRLFISQTVLKSALKAALNTKASDVVSSAALITSYANSVDEIGVPVLSVSVTELNFGDAVTKLSFDITNAGEGKLDYTITSDLPAKITITPASGETQNETDIIMVTVDRSGVSAGTYTPIISIISDGGNATIELTVIVP